MALHDMQSHFENNPKQRQSCRRELLLQLFDGYSSNSLLLGAEGFNMTSAALKRVWENRTGGDRSILNLDEN